MTSAPRPRQLAAIVLTGLLVAGCSAHQHHPASRTTTPARAGRPAGPPTGARPPVIPTESPSVTRGGRTLDPAPATAVIPPAAEASATAVGTARAWSIAANSSSYLDPNPGSWTERARPFVTGAEARAERVQDAGSGGSTWAQIQARKCVTGLRDLAVFIPSDAPSGPDLHIVYVSATVALTCASGAVYLSEFAAQLTVERVTGRWFVALVRH